MKPYYGPHKGITIYHGDCREVLCAIAENVTPATINSNLVWMGKNGAVAAKHIGAIVHTDGARDVAMEPSGNPLVLLTDPPYDWPSLPFERATAECIGVFGYGPTLVRWLREWPEPNNWLTWWPTNGGCRGAFHDHALQRESECVALYGKLSGEARIPKSDRAIDPARYGCLPDRKAPDVWRDPSPGLAFNARLRRHPNEKPLSLMVGLLRLFGGGLVLDPFMGSGTTLVAAKQLGRGAIGIEIEERYCEIAVKRLVQEILPLEPQRAEPEQMELLS